MRKPSLPLFERLRVRAPCSVEWDAMDDFGAHRRCEQCDLTVHDVASMTRAEVETLLEARKRGERVCLRLVVRESDRAVLVADGYVERARRAPPSRMIAAAVATATAMTACSPSPPAARNADLAVAPVASAPVPIQTSPPSPPSPPSPSPSPSSPTPSPRKKAASPAQPSPPPLAAPVPTKLPPHHVDVAGEPW